MKRLIYCIFFALSSCTFSPQVNQTDLVLIDEKKGAISIDKSNLCLILIGYANDIPIFGDAESNDFYSFEGEFRYYKKGRSGFLPVYCNDSVMIYVARKNAYYLSNEVIITKGQTEKKVFLPHKVSSLVPNMNGDTLFYTNGDNEVDRIRIFDVQGNKEVLGIYTWYEGFWYSKGIFYYEFFDENDYRSYLYTTSVPPVDKGILITNTTIDRMHAISYNGNYLSGSEKSSKNLYCVVNLETGDFKRQIIESANTIFSFFYKNKAYFYDSSTLEIKATISLEDI
jgi:hypothetical protein